ncbi:hypothetical protein MLD38_027496 [Melastoma candidum]|uniref:Uncharacterized protein n=1 Tax=Melastoma candidum TaxID=119954 RepID=A0ACB9P394_9MYRT|nr:hypothetical protein MLD38_027496 [Melastoma candidum]
MAHPLVIFVFAFSVLCICAAAAEMQSAAVDGRSPSPSPSPSVLGVGLPPSLETVDKTGVFAQAPAFRGTRRVQRHHSSGSAGGDVILGGFVSALVVAVLCYIRVTRRYGELHEEATDQH